MAIGIVYKFTHKTSKMWYIGSHKNSDRPYFGSGLVWRKALKKHGLENFDYEILYEGENYRNEEEKILKSLNAKKDKMSYNLKNEALGGVFEGIENGMFGKKHTKESAYMCGNAFRNIKRPDHSIKMSGENNPMYGKSFQSHGIVKRSKSLKDKTFDEIFGKEKSIEIRLKISASNTGKKKNAKQVVCPNCGLEGKGPNMSRYHFSNCRHYKLLEEFN